MTLRQLAESLQDLAASDAERWGRLAEMIPEPCACCGVYGDVVDELCPPCTARAEGYARLRHPTGWA